MLILIHDASVLIDLIAVDLLDAALSLPYVMETTDLVKSVIIRARQAEVLDRVIAAQKVEVLRSTVDELASIAELHSRIPALSLADCSVLFHASARGAVVLSGDSRLRQAAKDHSLTVCGTLWIFIELVAHGFLSGVDAAAVLERLMTVNLRLPRSECQKLITSWRNR
jgi:predicted nucleic acid-binding protein